MASLSIFSSFLRGSRVLVRLLRRPSEQAEEVITVTARPSLRGSVTPWLGGLLTHSERLDLELEDGVFESLFGVVFDPAMLEHLRNRQTCRLTLMSTERPDVASGEEACLHFVLGVTPESSPQVIGVNDRVHRLSAVLAPAATGTLLVGIALSLVQGHAAWFVVAALAFIGMRYVWAQLPRVTAIALAKDNPL